MPKRPIDLHLVAHDARIGPAVEVDAGKKPDPKASRRRAAVASARGGGGPARGAA
jgi:hypothetical protein